MQNFDIKRYFAAYSSFLEWNPDPQIAEDASRLYHGDIDNLELYGTCYDIISTTTQFDFSFSSQRDYKQKK